MDSRGVGVDAVRWRKCCQVDMAAAIAALFHDQLPSSLEDHEEDEEEASTEDWLRFALSSVSTDGRLLGFASSRQSLFMTASNPGSLVTYNISWQGVLPESENDEISAVLMLGLTDRSAAVWHVALVGFTSGYLRAYLPNGELLFSQWLHHSKINLIFCQGGGPHRSLAVGQGEELLVVYSDVVVAIDGFSLLQCLRVCNSTLVDRSDGNAMPSLSCKKWSLSEQKQVTGIASLGLYAVSPLSQLREASVKGEVTAETHHETVTGYIVSGTEPPLAAYRASEAGSRHILSAVAIAVAHRLTAAVASQLSWASSWLGWKDAKNTDSSQAGLEPSAAVPLWHQLYDPGRRGTSVTLSPCARFVAMTDSLGRVMQVEASTLLVLRLWKGYRGAQCGWVMASEEEPEGKPRSVVYLLIYAPRRGILEIWPSEGGARIAAFSVGKHCRLVSNSTGLLGAADVAHALPVPFQCSLLHPSGSMWLVDVPFTAALSASQQSRLADERYLDIIRDSSSLPREETRKQLLAIQNEDLALQALQSALRLPDTSSILLQTVKMFAERWGDLDEEHVIQLHCAHYVQFLELLVAIDDEEMPKTSNETSLTEILHQHRCIGNAEEAVTNLVATQAALCHREAENSPINSLSVEEYLYCFSLAKKSDSTGVKLQEKLKQADMDSLGVTLFKKYFDGHISSTKLFSWMKRADFSLSQCLTLLVHGWLSHPSDIDGVSASQLDAGLRLLFSEGFDVDSWNDVVKILERTKSTPSAWLAAVFVSSLFSARPQQDVDDSWDAVDSAQESWSLIQVQLQNINCLVRALQRGLTVDDILMEGPTVVTTYVACWAVSHKLLVAQLFPSTTEDKESSVGDKVWSEVEDLLEVFPYSLSQNILLAACARQAIEKWQSEPEDTSLLKLTLDYCSAIENAAVQHALISWMWQSHFHEFVSSLVTLLDKVGKTVRDGICQRQVGLTTTASKIFLQVVGELLHLLQQVASTSTGQLPECKLEESWLLDGQPFWPPTSMWATLYEQRDVNIQLVILQQQLVALLHVRLVFQHKFKPTMCFSNKSRQHLSSALHQRSAVDPRKISDDLREERETILCQLAALAVQSQDEEWVSKLLLLSDLLGVPSDAVRRSLILSLYAEDASRHGLASQLVSSVQDKPRLGFDLLRVCGRRVAGLMERSLASSQQRELIANLPPHVTSWMNDLSPGVGFTKGAHGNSTAREDIATCLAVLRQTAALLSDSSQQHDTADLLIRALESL